MKKLSIISIIFIAFMTFMTPANAKGFGVIGTSNSIHKIQSIDMPGQNGEKLYLGYVTETYFLLAGVYMSDQGYVIGIEGNDSSYYNMPTGEELESMQSLGVMPKELPKYKISWVDYAIGFSLWIILAVFGLFKLLMSKLQSSSSDEDTYTIGKE